MNKKRNRKDKGRNIVARKKAGRRNIFLPLLVVAGIALVLFFLIDGRNIPPSEEEVRRKRINDEVSLLIEKMTLEDKVAQLFMVTRKVEEENPGMGFGGIIYFAGDLRNPDQTRKMIQAAQEESSIPLFIGVDEEGGIVSRVAENPAFGVKVFPPLSKTGTTKKAYEIGNTIGAYLADLGFNLDFAPVADVYTNPANKVVSVRSFGKDPAVVSDMVEAEMKGLMENGIMVSLKHFPGHGHTTGDTHDNFAVSNKNLGELRKTELLPFVRGIEKGAELIMVGHISLPKIIGDRTPASLSKIIIEDLLRKELGFEGIVITDALNMGAVSKNYRSYQAAVAAFMAGVDILLMPEDLHLAYQGILEGLKKGELKEEDLNKKLKRILTVKVERSIKKESP